MNKQTGARILLIGFNIAIPLVAIMPNTLGSTAATASAMLSLPFLLLSLYFGASTVAAFRADTPRRRVLALSAHAGITLLAAMLGFLTTMLSPGGAFALVALAVIYVPLWLAAAEPSQDFEPLELFPDER